MKVVLLCGGKGTRLAEQTEFMPKPLVHIEGKPILWHIMSIYAHHGFNEFILCLGYKGEMIKNYFLNFDFMKNDFTIDFNKRSKFLHGGEHACKDWKIHFVDTGQETMTGGRLKRIKHLIGNDETFLLTYGDGVSDVNISELVEFHKNKGKIATLTGVHPSSQFGVIETNEGLAESFKEKPRLSGCINGGFFVFNKQVFDYLEGDSTILEEEPLKNLCKEGQLAVFSHEGFWQCMDTQKDVDYLNSLCNKGEADWKVWGEINE